MKCLYCGEDKLLEEFYPRNKARCKLCVRKYALLWQRNHSTYHKEKQQRYKSEALTHYSNGSLACVRCGFEDIRALSIDHIKGGGLVHYNSMTGRNIYLWLKKNNYPEGYQTLCMNCQWIKREENGENRKSSIVINH